MHTTMETFYSWISSSVEGSDIRKHILVQLTQIDKTVFATPDSAPGWDSWQAVSLEPARLK